MPHTPPEGYRHHTPMMVRYGDLDNLNHVNNAKYLTYFEHGRVTYIRELGLWDGYASELGLILAKSVVEFKLPLHLEDGLIDVWTRSSRLGNKSFDMGGVITCQREGKQVVAAEVINVMVVFDYGKDQAMPIPVDWREKIIAFEPALDG